MQVIIRDITSIHPYPGNPRKAEAAVEPVARSIREFGFRQPIVVDGENIIVVGHVRFWAAQSLGLVQVPVHVAADLTPAQARAYRLADNKTGEYSGWDFEKLELELTELKARNISLEPLGFQLGELESCLQPTETATPAFEPMGAESQPRLDRKRPVTCPECGHEFIPV